MLDSIHVIVESVQVDGENNTVITLRVAEDAMPTLEPTTARFVQTPTATEFGIAVLPYGGVIFGGNVTQADVYYEVTADIKGTRYIDTTNQLTTSSEVGAEFVLTAVSFGGSDADSAT